MSGSEIPPGPSSRIPKDSSPFVPPPMEPPRHMAKRMRLYVPSQEAPLEQFPPDNGSSMLVLALEEHMEILRHHLEGAALDLDHCDPDEYEDLEKTLREVSRMISQITSTADVLTRRRPNLTNKLVTIVEENGYLNEALLREHAKKQKEMTQSITPNVVTLSGRKRAPSPSSPKCESAPKQRRQFTAPKANHAEALENEYESLMQMLTLEDVAGTSSQSTVAPPSRSGSAIKRSYEVSAAREDSMDHDMSPASAKKGRLSQEPTAMSMLPESITTENIAIPTSAFTVPAVASAHESTDPCAHRAPAVQAVEPMEVKPQANGIDQTVEFHGVPNNAVVWNDLANMQDMRRCLE
ncbi:hypothetical protein HPB50_021261 [Hyalomma asiaticum]|uniref:Uncharacterized protein n=1 Tax=Hyalomma asiaticum TaxID=266040 RepID=A0ACB7TL37_HYAAI|nr:hypothetical protein HPB50_021261 [Hyalomma asiaticum]